MVVFLNARLRNNRQNHKQCKNDGGDGGEVDEKGLGAVFSEAGAL